MYTPTGPSPSSRRSSATAPRGESDPQSARPRTDLVAVPRDDAAVRGRPVEPERELVGREDELRRLQRFIDDDSQDVLLLSGARGSGRSALLDRIARRNPARTAIVRARPAAAGTPWAGALAILIAAGVDPAGIDLSAAIGRAGDERMDELRAALATIAATPRLPAVVIVDDLDLMDARTVEAVAFFAAHAAGTPIRLLAAARSRRPDALAALPFLRLDPLSDDDLLRIAPSLAPRETDPVTAALVVSASGGAPGALAIHLARLTWEQRTDGAPLATPLAAAFPDEEAALADRRGVDDRDRRLLALVATAAAVSTGALPALAGADLDRVEPLIARGLLARHHGFVTVADPELRSLLYWGLDPAALAAAHADAADAEGRDGDPDLQVWHGSHAHHDTTTASTLYAAASSLIGKGALPAALELAERALALTGIGVPVQEQLAFARELLLRGGAAAAGRHLPAARARMTRRQLFQLVTLEMIVRTFVEDRVHLDPVDALIGRFRAELPEECAELTAQAGVLLVLHGDLAEGRRRIRAAHDLAPGAASGRTLRHWADRIAVALSGPPASAAARAPERVPSDADVEVQVAAVLALMWEQRHDAAREGLAMILGPLRAPRSPWARRALPLAFENELRSGDTARALELARRAARPDLDPDRYERNMLAWAAMLEDRRDDLQRLLETRDLPTASRGLFDLTTERLLGSAALLRGDLLTAVDRLAEVVEATADLDPQVLRCQPDLIEARWRSGDVDGARRSTERFARTASSSRWSVLAVGRCTALFADDPEAALAAVMDSFTGADSAYEAARTRALAAAVAERAGHRAEAEEAARIAADRFTRLGVVAWARFVRPAPPSASASGNGMPVLTDTEMAVLRLARRGAQNREISAALFLSLRTVELRLTQIYRKFDARSRAHLFTLLPEGWPEDGGRSADA